MTDEKNSRSREHIVDQRYAGDQSQSFLQQITKEPLLTFEEEVELTQKIEYAREARERLARGMCEQKEREQLHSLIEDGTAAHERLVLANTRLVVSVASRYRSYNFTLLDLVQEGIIGLIRAIGKFDPNRGLRFSTYATWWIRQAISRFIENQSRTIRLPAHMQSRMRKIMRMSKELSQRLGRQATDAEIGEVLDLSPETVRQAKNVSQPIISLEVPQDEDGDRVLLDTYEDHDAPSPEDVVTHSLSLQTTYDALKDLSEQEVEILTLRFGLDGNREHTLKELGSEYGVTKERIRQIQDKALDQIRYRS